MTSDLTKLDWISVLNLDSDDFMTFASYARIKNDENNRRNREERLKLKHRK